MDLLQGWSEATLTFSKLYCLSCALQSVGLGLVSLRLGVFGKNRAANFLLGAAMTPFVQFVFCFVLLLLPWKLPHALFALPLPIAALVVIGLQARPFSIWLKSKPWRVGLTKGDVLRRCLTALTVLMALVVCIKMLPGLKTLATQNYTVRNDNAEYVTKATYLADTQSLARPFLSLEDGPLGEFTSDNHFPSYTIYLAYALMHTPASVGYPFDMPAQAAFLLVGVYLFFAFAGALFALCQNNRKWIPVGVLLFFLIPQIGYTILYASVRDGLRCLGLLILLCYLLRLQPREDGAFYARDYIGIAAFSFLSSATHAISLPITVLMILVWGVSNMARKQKRHNRSVWFATLLGLLGCAVGNYPVIIRFTPKLFAILASVLSKDAAPVALAGAPEGQATMSFIQKIKVAFFFDSGRFFLLLYALLVVVMALFFLYLILKKRGVVSEALRASMAPGEANLRFLGLFVAILMLAWIPIAEALNSVHSFSAGGFINHSRYFLQNALFCVLLLVYAMSVADSVFLGKRRLLAGVICLCMSATLFVSIDRSVLFGRQYNENLLAYCRISIGSAEYQGDVFNKEAYRPKREIAAKQSDEYRVAVTSQGLLYPFNAKAVLLGAADTYACYAAQTPEEAENALRESRIRAIITVDSKWESRYADHALGQYIASSPYVTAQPLTGQDTTIYYIDIPA